MLSWCDKCFRVSVLLLCFHKVCPEQFNGEQVPYYKTTKYFWSFDDTDLFQEHSNVIHLVPGVLDDAIRLSSHANISSPWLDLGSVTFSCVTKPYRCQEGFTILFWAKMDGDQNNKILLNAAEVENARGIHLRISQQRLRFSTTGLELTQDILPRTVRRYLDAEWNFEYWTHVGLLWESNSKVMKIFYNCSEADYVSAGILFDRNAHVFEAPRRLIVGASNQLLNSAEAEIDELGIWDVVLKKKDICHVFNSRRVHGEYSEWSKFTSCSQTCGDGFKTRTRTCTNPAPQNGGRNCSQAGPSRQSTTCQDKKCPVDGGYSQWSSFSECSKTCSGGQSIRVRTCTEPRPQYGGRECIGNPREIRVCNLNPCPVHGGYSAWSDFTQCTKSCENGTRYRNRTCNNPKPQHNGRNCSHFGPSFEITPCNTFWCPVHGDYTEWSSFTKCTLSCGSGQRTRTRNCTNPTPLHGGENCDKLGPGKEIKPCNSHPCPIDGWYSVWSTFTACTKSCENGTKFRTRNCTEPMFGGKNCSEFGRDVERVLCNTHWCPIHGNYSQWSSFTPCSTTCNNGTMVRTRTCTNPAPKHLGRNCSHLGSPREEVLCNLNECPIDGEYGSWSSYSECSTTCGENGSQIRTRLCNNPGPKFGGRHCSRLGEDTQTRACNVIPCPIDGAWGPWSNYSRCSKTCETGRRRRTRKCDHPRPQYGGRNCTTISRETSTEIYICNTQLCPDVVIIIMINMTNEKWRDVFLVAVSNEYRKLARKLVKNVEAFYGKNSSLRRVRVLNIRKGSVLVDLELSFFNRNYSGITDIQNEMFLKKKLGNLPVIILEASSKDVPSSLRNITMYNTSSQSIMVKWEKLPSSLRNGETTSYTVLHRAVENMTSDYSETAVDPDTLFLEIKDLKIYHPYFVSVYSTNRRGNGAPSLPKIVWTEMEAPNAAPIIQSVYNISSTCIFIQWTEIPQKNIRGILLGFLLSYRLVKEAKVTKLKFSPSANKTFLENLKKFSKYEVNLLGFNRIGNGLASSTILIKTDEDVPTKPPQNVNAQNTSSTSLAVSWGYIPNDFIHGVLRGYIVFYKSEYSHIWKNITVDPRTHNVDIQGLIKYHKYFVQVGGYTSKGTGKLSKAVKVMTDEDVPSYYPTGIIAVNTSSTSILVQWDGISQKHIHGILLKYRIYYKRRALKDRPWRIWNVSPLSKAIELVKLRKFTKYDIQIAGVTSKGPGVRSPNKVAITAEDLPSHPVDFVRPRPTSSTSVSLTWGKIPRSQLHGILRGYKILYRVADGNDGNKGDVYSLRKAIPFQHHMVLRGLLKFTKYGIRIIGFTIGDGKGSKEYFVKTLQDRPSKPPINIQARSRWTSSTIPVSWQPINPPYYVHGVLRGYHIKYKPIKDTLRSITADYTWITVSPSTLNMTIKGLKSSTSYSIQVLAFTSIGNGAESKSIVAETCSCQNEFTTNWWELTPYSEYKDGESRGIFPAILQKAIEMCCSGCAKQDVPKIHFKTTNGPRGLKKGIVEVNQNINDDIDFHFPIHGSKSQTSYTGGFPYVALVQSPGAAFIVSSENQYKESERVIKIVLTYWPFCLALFFGSYFVGFVLWVIERKSNPECFPESLLYGPINGLWWAFITITTVGYGDKTPKSVLGRSIAIMCPIIGQIMIAIFVAQVTSQLSAGIIGVDIMVYGKKMAVIKNSSEYRLGIKKNAKFDPEKSYSNLHDIYKDLASHEVFGALIDTYTVASEQELFNDAKLTVNKIFDYSLHYGVVLGGHSRKLQPCLQHFLMRETEQLYQIVTTNVKPLKNVLTRNVRVDKTKSLFDAESKVYRSIIIALSALFVFLVIIGFIGKCVIAHVLPRCYPTDRNSVIAKAREKAFNSRQRQLRSLPMEKHLDRIKTRLMQTKKRHINEIKSYIKRRTKAEKQIEKSLKKANRRKAKENKIKTKEKESETVDGLSIVSLEGSVTMVTEEMWKDMEPLEGLFSLV